MNLQSKLEQFREDNPYDVDTQAKRLLAAGDKDLIVYTLALGLATAKQRQRHYERDYIKNIGEAPPKERLERLVPGRVTGSVKIIPIKPSKRMKNAMEQYIMDVWRINGEQPLGDANYLDLTTAEKRAAANKDGQAKNEEFYKRAKKRLDPRGLDKVRQRWDEKSIRTEIEKVYGEFRKGEAGGEAA